MRVVMIGQKGIPATMGGVERHVEELSTRLAASGIDVIAYARPRYTQFPTWSTLRHRGVRVMTLPSIPTKHADAISHTIFATIHAMVRVRPDIYHFHGVGPALCAWMPRLFTPHARVVVTFHCIDRHHAKWGWFARAALRIGEWAACRFPHATVTVGTTLAEYCQTQFGRVTTCIPNGVSESQSSTTEDAPLLEGLGLFPRRYFLVVTRLVPHKGVHDVIAAFQELRRVRPEYAGEPLVIVGAASFTEAYAHDLRRRSAGDAMIRFLGIQHGAVLDALYRNCTAFVHASHSEGLPMVVLEAAAAGAVPVVSDIPEHREVVAQIGGVMFRAGDARDLQVKLEVLLAARAAVPEMGAEIRSRVLRHYGWDDAVELLSTRYRELCGPVIVPSVPVELPNALPVV